MNDRITLSRFTIYTYENEPEVVYIAREDGSEGKEFDRVLFELAIEEFFDENF